MSLSGSFDPVFGRPFLDGRVLLTRFGIAVRIPFIVDTGADSSLLAPSDAFKIGVDYSALEGEEVSMGTAGPTYTFIEPASLVFDESDGTAHVYNVQLAIAEPNVDFIHMPSILGRDILDRWRMIYDPAGAELTFTVHSADVTLPIT